MSKTKKQGGEIIRKGDKLIAITLDLYNQDNFIGLTEYQINKVYDIYTTNLNK